MIIESCYLTALIDWKWIEQVAFKWLTVVTRRLGKLAPLNISVRTGLTRYCISVFLPFCLLSPLCDTLAVLERLGTWYVELVEYLSNVLKALELMPSNHQKQHSQEKGRD